MLNNNILICGDNIKVLKTMEDNSIDLIVTSPPYNNWRNRRTQKNKKDYWDRTNIVYDSFNDKMSDNDYIEWQIKIINEMVRVIKPTGTICYNHKDRIFNFEVLSPIEWIKRSKSVLRQRITWNRMGMQAFNNVRFYRMEEDIYLLGKVAKGFKWNKEFSKYNSIWNIPPSRKTKHPASFPEEIPKRLIQAFTDKNDIVLDPFVGSGTTCKVAKDLGRNYIGIDISQEYIYIAKERLNI